MCPTPRLSVDKQMQNPYSILYHEARIATIRLNLNNSRTNVNMTTADYGAQKIHAGYMMWTWMVWVPIGTFVSRFYKETWSTNYLWNKRPWFIIHTFCMLFAIVMSLTAYVLVLYDRGAWLPLAKPTSVHGIIGLIAISFLLIQCIAGWFRPPNDRPRRFVAKLHYLTGVSCYLLGIINIILAPMLTQNILPCGATLITGVWLAVYITLYIIMTSYICWTDSHLKIGGWRAISGYPMPITTSEEAVRPSLRTAYLGIFILLSVVFAIVAIGSMKSPSCTPTFNIECSSLLSVTL